MQKSFFRFSVEVLLEFFCNFGYDSFHRGHLSFGLRVVVDSLNHIEVPSVFIFPTLIFTLLRNSAPNEIPTVYSDACVMSDCAGPEIKFPW